MEACYHFVSGNFTSHRRFMPDKEYGDALDNFSKGCSDMLLTDSAGRIFMGKRKVHPQPDWWYVGGRIFPGESPAMSCSRLLKRELSLDIDPSRFTTICSNSLVWGMRQQDPQEHGTCDINIVLTVQLTDDEALLVVLDQNEYTDSKWVEPSELLSGDYHPALQLSCRALLSRRKVCEMQSAVQSGASDQDIAKLAREYCAITQPPSLGKSDYVLRNESLCYEASVDVRRI